MDLPRIQESQPLQQAGVFTRRSLVRAGAWTVPTVVAVMAVPEAANASPGSPLDWGVVCNTPSVTTTNGNYAVSFTVSITSGTLGQVSCVWTARSGGAIGAANTGAAFAGWTGTGGGLTDGAQRGSWTFLYGTNPAHDTNSSTFNFAGTMNSISAPASGGDVPLTIVFAGTTSGAGTRSFTMTRAGTNQVSITPS